MITRRPLIGLTIRGKPFDPGRRDATTAAFEWISNAFSECVVREGGTPFLLTNECPTDEVGRLVALADGLLLTGGEDVHPQHFKENVAVDNLTINEKRDAVEMAAIAEADRLGMPILGVCRGIQVLNIARGGTIYQDLTQQYPKAPRDHSRGPSRVAVQTHSIKIDQNSRLARASGACQITAATDHHQALDKLGKSLKVVARSPEDDVIEAVEESGDRFVVGVQWHPEIRPDEPESQRLFRAFVEAAEQFAAKREAAE